MSAEWVRLVIFVLVILGAVYGAYRFDRDVVEPALTRHGARLLDITEAEYRSMRRALLTAPCRWLRSKTSRAAEPVDIKCRCSANESEDDDEREQHASWCLAGRPQ